MAYKTVTIRNELMKIVDQIVEVEAMGYNSRSDFVHDAIRRRIESLLSLFPELKEEINAGKIKD